MRRNNANRSARLGAVLLIVLIFLVLFSLVAITFVVVANRYKATAIAAARHDQTGDSPQRLCDQSILQALIGSRSSASALLGHDLLSDLYGNDSMAGRITSWAFTPSQDILRITFNREAGANFSIDGYYGGCVFTMMDGSHKGISTRVLDYYPNGSDQEQRPHFLVQMFEPEANVGVLPQSGGWLAAGHRFIVNGRPFNGAGAGFTTAGGNYAPSLFPNQPGGREIALLPNYRSYLTRDQMGMAAGAGPDESYDAADNQNMFLYYAGELPDGSVEIIPSFHRPELFAYWRKRNGGNLDPQLARMISLRPLPSDHPNFTGSNQAMAASSNWVNTLCNATGPFDVDNDGDGIPDSIWIDIGLPVKRAPDGRMYKPLVAFMIQDLDGRIDINASGSLAHISSPTQTEWSANAYNTAAWNAGMTFVPRGQGYGPAEINWGLLQGLNANTYQNLLLQKYGQDQSPGVPANASPGAVAYLKPLGQPPAEQIQVGMNSSYSLPFDVWGQSFTAIDLTGRPLMWMSVQPFQQTNAASNNPYQMNTIGQRTGGGTTDSPFTLMELEKLLRRHDRDVQSIRSRLDQLDAARRAITTRSSTIPTSYDILPASTLSGYRAGGGGIIGLMDAKLQSGGVSDAALRAATLRALIPWEIFHGQRMDLNRPFGNGRDDDVNGAKNGVIDEPLENGAADNGERVDVTGASTAAPGHQGAVLDICNDDPIIKNPIFGFQANFQGMNAYKENMFARQMYARHLYCLMRLLTDEAYVHPTSELNIDQGTQQDLTYRRIAQWAINVVDFRDPDAIMTSFEYDANPWNGWNVDGDIATDEQHTDRRVVFGMEIPDMVLSEATAFHDKNLRDTKYEGANGKELIEDPNAATPVQGDNDLDQYRVPQGTVLIELGCPRLPTSLNPRLPLEIYAYNSMSNQYYLDMARMAPAGNNVPSYPVWRVAISTPHSNTNQGANYAAQNHADSATFEPPSMRLVNPQPMPLERIIWFTGQNANGYPEAGQQNSEIYYSRGRNNPPMLAPGSIAVIGSRTNTYLGMTNANPDALAAQLITVDPTTDQVTVTDRNGAQTQKSAVCIVAGANPNGWTNTGSTAPQGIGVSISEPLPANNYYQEPTVQIAGFPQMDAYDDITTPQGTFPDQPLDYVNPRPLVQNNWTRTGTYTDVRTASLQRLADPTQAFNPLSNPYITIDWLPLDLTVFNGADRRDNPGKKNPWPAGVNWDTLDPWTNAATPYSADPSERFGTRQRGDADYTFWQQYTQDPTVTAEQGAVNGENFRFDLQHSLGDINAPMIAPSGYPQTPFPWIHHANRPLVSAMELLQVPASSQARLLHEFSMRNKQNSTFSAQLNTATSPYDVGAAKEFHAPYAHLLNFYQTSPDGGTPAANFYRLFDYVEVPSRYIHAEKWFNSVNFATSAGAEFFRPPYNKISRFQDPGRVNLNTIGSSSIWGTADPQNRQDGGVSGGRGPSWAEVATSRRGYATPGINDDYPSRFCNPFRAAGSADLMPLASMRVAGVDATLLRRQLSWSAGSPPTPGRSLFADIDAAQGTDYRPHNDLVYERHPYFSTETLTALDNKVKTHSNVFACWVTVGFFEVEAVQPSEAIPDGWMLGQELNTDTGDMKRHRAFYIIDRSMPVGYFLPGEALNAERAILLRRYIQ